jgi:hypothetical protein
VTPADPTYRRLAELLTALSGHPGTTAARLAELTTLTATGVEDDLDMLTRRMLIIGTWAGRDPPTYRMPEPAEDQRTG